MKGHYDCLPPPCYKRASIRVEEMPIPAASPCSCESRLPITHLIFEIGTAIVRGERQTVSDIRRKCKRCAEIARSESVETDA